MTVRWGFGGICRPVFDKDEIKGVVSVELDAMVTDNLPDAHCTTDVAYYGKSKQWLMLQYNGTLLMADIDWQEK